MKFKKSFWKYSTFLLILMLSLNPASPLFTLGLIIDAVGLEMFLLLIKIQFITLASFYFHTYCKPILKPVYRFIQKFDRYFFIPTKSCIKQYPAILCHSIPGFMLLAFGLSYTVYS